jgi:hypothetical protein
MPTLPHDPSTKPLTVDETIDRARQARSLYVRGLVGSALARLSPRGLLRPAPAIPVA